MNPAMTSSFIFTGQAALYSHAAAGLILTQSDSAQLVEGVIQVRTQLIGHSIQEPTLEIFFPAIDHFQSAVAQTDTATLASSQASLARSVAEVPNSVWRLGTFPYTSARAQYVAYLEDVRDSLGPLTGTRAYVMSAADDDKAFIRIVLGSIRIFLDNVDSKEDRELAGMIVEVGAQLQDSAIHLLAARSNVLFPLQPTGRINAPIVVASTPIATPPETLESAAAPVESAPETQVSTTTTRLDYEYHPDSDHPIGDVACDANILRIAQQIEDTGIDWPYDFVRWARSLYLWASEVDEIPSRRVHNKYFRGRTRKGTRNNILMGLRRLGEQGDSMTLQDIRRRLGPATIALEKDLEGIPNTWPCDMPDVFAAMLIAAWDGDLSEKVDSLHATVTSLIAIWQLANGLPNEDDIVRTLRNAQQRFRRALQNGTLLEASDTDADAQKIVSLLPEIIQALYRDPTPPDYHPDSDRALTVVQERLIQHVQERLDRDGPYWPGDFVRWVRSLYRWTQEIEEIPTQIIAKPIGRGRTRKGLSTNLSNGLKALANADKVEPLSLLDIRKHLGPTSVAVGHPIAGIPTNWPQDMPNHFGKALIRAWDGHPSRDPEDLRSIATTLALAWKLSANQGSEIRIVKILARAIGNLGSYADGGRIRRDKIEQTIAAMTAPFPRPLRQQLQEAGR